MTIGSWDLVQVGEPLVLRTREVDEHNLPPGHVLLRVSGCGVCHTDLSFAKEGVPTRHPLPLTLGHEIAGVVTHAGPGADEWVGASVVVPAVIPCGSCASCKAGRGAICPAQVFPGNDDHGGFASHVAVPSRGLCRIRTDSPVDLAEFAVIADAVTTPYQALHNAELRAGHLAIFIGIGGVGIFGVQIARALGAQVAAIDTDPEKVARALAHGALWAQVAEPGNTASLRSELRAFAKKNGLPTSGWRIFETSGHPAGQTLAFSLLNHGAHLGVVGYTKEKVTLPLSNLMAFDATARGTWGCLPEHYPAVVDLVGSGKVKLAPFIEKFPMGQINEVFVSLHRGQQKRRPVLVPDFVGLS